MRSIIAIAITARGKGYCVVFARNLVEAPDVDAKLYTDVPFSMEVSEVSS